MSGSNTNIQTVSNQQDPVNCYSRSVQYFTNTATNTTDSIDFTLLQQQNKIDQIQTVYIDNADNTAEFTLVCGASNQRIIAPPGSQGYYPLLAPNPPKFSFATTGGLQVSCFFMNVAMPLAVWYPASNGGGGGPVTISMDVGYQLQVGSGGTLAAGTYYFLLTAPIAFTFNRVIFNDPGSGNSYDFVVKQNGTDISGGSHTVTGGSGNTNFAIPATPSVAAGDSVQLTISSVTGTITEFAAIALGTATLS